MIRGQSLYDWCQANGEWGQQLLFEFGDGNNSQQFIDDETGIEMTPHDFSRGSSKKIPWTCNKGHMWKSTIVHRTCSGRNCPKCKGEENSIRKSTPKYGENDLYTWCTKHAEFGQQLINEFKGLDEEYNKISINDVTYGSHKRLYWICNKGHIWMARVLDRTKDKTKCPYCFSNHIVREENSLYKWCIDNGVLGQQLLDEWTGLDEHDNPIKVNEVSYGSNKKVQWKCNKGHIWISNIIHRTAKGFERGCPYCNLKGTSFPEQFIYHSLKQIYPNTITRGKYQGYEYDITIPELKLCIEYSGMQWHKDRLDRDEMKKKLCKEYGVNFLQIYAHYGEIQDTEGNEADDSYTKEQIIYKVNHNKSLHIEQLKQIAKFILEQYAPEHTINEIDFTKAEIDANNTLQGNTIEEEENT